MTNGNDVVDTIAFRLKSGELIHISDVDGYIDAGDHHLVMSGKSRWSIRKEDVTYTNVVSK